MVGVYLPDSSPNPVLAANKAGRVYYPVFFNTFEELKLPIKGPIEDAGVIKLYEPSPTPCLNVAPVEYISGRVPLIPLFLAGSSTLTTPHVTNLVYNKRRDSGFPMGCADSAMVDGRRSSDVYEVNPWLWQFGRSRPRMGGLNAGYGGRPPKTSSPFFKDKMSYIYIINNYIILLNIINVIIF